MTKFISANCNPKQTNVDLNETETFRESINRQIPQQ
jgi:hypothetical protein